MGSRLRAYAIVLNLSVLTYFFFVALENYFSQLDGGVLEEFPATISTIEVFESAVVFHIDTSAMEHLRRAVEFASEHLSFREREIELGLSPYELTRLVHIPSITHSTFVRYILRVCYMAGRSSSPFLF